MWQPGEVVAWREAWRGREYLAIPVRVVEDSEEASWAERGGFEGAGILITDGSWSWKDEAVLAEWLPRGRCTRDEVIEIRRVGEQVRADWSFPTGWEGGQPDASCTVPELPDA